MASHTHSLSYCRAVLLLPLSFIIVHRDLSNLEILENSLSVYSLVNIVLIRPGHQEATSILNFFFFITTHVYQEVGDKLHRHLEYFHANKIYGKKYRF